MSVKLKRDLRDQQETIRTLTVTNLTQRVLIESVNQLLEQHRVEDAKARLRLAIDRYNGTMKKETDTCHH